LGRLQKTKRYPLSPWHSKTTLDYSNCVPVPFLPFKKLMSEWARLRIAVVRAKAPRKKLDLTNKLNAVWSKLLNYHSPKMSNEDLDLLRHLEHWTVKPQTTNKIANAKPHKK